MMRFLVAIIFSGLLAIGMSSGAAAQNMSDLMKRKYDILQQQADAERVRADTLNRQVEAQTTRATGENGPQTFHRPYVVPTGGDVLAGIDAATYTLGNGVIIRISGVLIPSTFATCTAYCR